MGFKVVEFTTGAAVADDGTVTGIAYPSGTNQAFFTGDNASGGGVVYVDHNDELLETADEVDIAYGASTITLTNKSGATWAAGTHITLQLDYAAADTVNVIAQAAVADLNLTDLSTSDTYTDAAVNAQFALVEAKLNAVLAAVRGAGVIDAS